MQTSRMKAKYIEIHQVLDEEKNFFLMKINETLNGAENDVVVRGRYH